MSHMKVKNHTEQLVAGKSLTLIPATPMMMIPTMGEIGTEEGGMIANEIMKEMVAKEIAVIEVAMAMEDDAADVRGAVARTVNALERRTIWHHLCRFRDRIARLD
jgi:hypothetical protein